MKGRIGLLVVLGTLSIAPSSALAAPQASAAVQKECADHANNSCLPRCYNNKDGAGAVALRKCEADCMELYKICLKVELEAQANPGQGSRQPNRPGLQAAPATGGSVMAPPAKPEGNELPIGTMQLFRKQ